MELVVDSEEIEDSVYLLIVHFNKLLYDIGLWDLSSKIMGKDKLKYHKRLVVLRFVVFSCLSLWIR